MEPWQGSRIHDKTRLIRTEEKRGTRGAGEKKVAMAKDGCDAPSVTYYQQQSQYQAPLPPRRSHARVAQKLERWIFLYNVTTGLYMLDWWERCIFNAVFLVFLVVACYNCGHYLCRLGAGLLACCGDDSEASFAFGRGIREEWLGGVGGGGAGV